MTNIHDSDTRAASELAYVFTDAARAFTGNMYTAAIGFVDVAMDTPSVDDAVAAAQVEGAQVTDIRRSWSMDIIVGVLVGDEVSAFKLSDEHTHECVEIIGQWIEDRDFTHSDENEPLYSLAVIAVPFTQDDTERLDVLLNFMPWDDSPLDARELFGLARTTIGLALDPADLENDSGEVTPRHSQVLSHVVQMFSGRLLKRCDDASNSELSEILDRALTAEIFSLAVPAMNAESSKESIAERKGTDLEDATLVGCGQFLDGDNPDEAYTLVKVWYRHNGVTGEPELSFGMLETSSHEDFSQAQAILEKWMLHGAATVVLGNTPKTQISRVVTFREPDALASLDVTDKVGKLNFIVQTVSDLLSEVTAKYEDD